MSSFLQVDHKTVAGVSLALTTGVALYSSYKLWSLQKQKVKEDVYESKKSLYEYLIFHYGQPQEILKWPQGPKDSLDFPKRCADLCMKHFKPGVSLHNYKSLSGPPYIISHRHSTETEYSHRALRLRPGY